MKVWRMQYAYTEAEKKALEAKGWTCNPSRVLYGNSIYWICTKRQSVPKGDTSTIAE